MPCCDSRPRPERLREQRLVKAALLLSALAHVASAQVIRGVVRAGDGQVVPGVILTLLDSLDMPAGRVLGDEQGRFLINAPHPGTFHIEAKRLAFRPTIDSSITLNEGATVTRNLVLTGRESRLSEVHVTAASQCQINPDSSTAAFAAWEEASKALRASQLTRLTRPYRADVTLFLRHQDPDRSRDLRTDSASRPGLPIRPFISPPADELAELGYLTRTAAGTIYHAPDEDVLLSASFASTHCLSLLPDSGSSRNVRLGFSPIRGRNVPEINGVLTLDRESSELRLLEFTFVNLKVSGGFVPPTGRIAFDHLPEGSWLISEWSITLPFVEVTTDAPQLPVGTPQSRARMMPDIARPAPMAHYGFQTTGGHITRVISGDEVIWARPSRSP